MNVQWRDFLLLAMLAGAVATPACGQTATLEVQAGSGGGQGAAPIPDFSGIWAHLNWPDVEPPAAGPGPVRNLSRRNGVSNAYQLMGDYHNPILKPEAAQIVKKAGEVASTGAAYPTPSNRCWPGGVPFVFWNIGMEMLQKPDNIAILYSNDHEVRHVRLNQQHRTPVTPSWYGDSVGRYEGDTLVIDTVGVKIGPFAMVDMYGTPHSPALHVVERYRLLDHEAAKEAEERSQRENVRAGGGGSGFAPDPDYKGKALRLEFTVEDEGVFTTTWSAAITYRRPLSPLGEWPESVCADNRHEYYTGKEVPTPTAAKPDF